VRVHFAGEHALELEPLDLLLEPADVLLDRRDGSRIPFGLGEFQQFASLLEAFLDPVECPDDRLELRALATELLRLLGLLPDRGVFEFPQDLREPLAAPLVVKGTPSAPRSAG
jgi:hypothetical protein